MTSYSDDSHSAMAEAMGDEEYNLMLIAEQGIAAKKHLHTLMDRYRWLGKQIAAITQDAADALVDYNNTKSDEDLERLELYTDMALTYTQYRSEVREEIRVERENIRWLRAEYQRTKS